MHVFFLSWNTFLQLHTNSQEQLKDLLVNNASNNSASGADDDCDPDTTKVIAFYNAAMDEKRIEEMGIGPLDDLLALCDKAAAEKEALNEKGVASCLGELLSDYGISSFFSIGASPDNKKSDMTICQIAQGGIGMPDKNYYFDEDKEDKRTSYKKHIAKMLSLLDDPVQLATTKTESDSNDKGADGSDDVEGKDVVEINASYTTIAEQIYNLEEKLAKAHMTKTENRDPETTYNKMSVDELTKTICEDKFNFTSYFTSATKKTIDALGDVNVRNKDALRCAANLISASDKDLLRHYLRWRSIRSCAKYLPEVFVSEDFNFNERILAGTSEIKPRWKRAMAFTESALGEALGKMYCAKYFDESSKTKALFIVESVRQALEERLKEVDWIKSESTREEALKKMSQFNVKIGYPDKWIDYATLDIQEKDPFLTMVFKSRKFDHIREVKEMNAPTDKDKWFMTPQTVNAYYHPNLNEIVFPAAILQAPFFDPDADDAINFGSMGAVVGHEMTHGFDDKGRKFNFEGNMLDWWTKDDGEEYEKRVQVMVDQANKIVIHGQNVQGKLTCGENIADLGGLRLALRALKGHLGDGADVIIDGFTPTQRFFLGWAFCWRQNITKERALQLLTIDPHGPNPSRCNGPLSNMEEFHEAFDVPENSIMFIAKGQRVDIW